MKRILILFFLLVVTNYGQSLKENWLPLARSNAGTIYLNTEGIIEYNNGDVFVWVLQEHSEPIIIESVDGRIYRTKTYYLFNKKLKRFSYEQIIYYDEDGNALRSFSYGTTAKAVPYRYNYPVIKNTNEAIIFSKILELTADEDEE